MVHSTAGPFNSGRQNGCACFYVDVVCSEINAGKLFEFVQVLKKMEQVLRCCPATLWFVLCCCFLYCKPCLLYELQQILQFVIEQKGGQRFPTL